MSRRRSRHFCFSLQCRVFLVLMASAFYGSKRFRFPGGPFFVQRSAQDEKAGDPTATLASEAAGDVLTHETNNTGFIELSSVPRESACPDCHAGICAFLVRCFLFLMGLQFFGRTGSSFPRAIFSVRRSAQDEKAGGPTATPASEALGKS